MRTRLGRAILLFPLVVTSFVVRPAIAARPAVPVPALYIVAAISPLPDHPS
jgi:hypothetical protein